MTTSRRDIGVAIGIPEPYTTELQGWRERHLQVIAEQGQPFLMHLRGSGSFRPLSPVVFVPLAQGTSECEQLEAKVRSGVLAQEVSFPHHVVRREVPGVGVLAVRDSPFGAPLPGRALPPGLLG